MHTLYIVNAASRRIALQYSAAAFRETRERLTTTKRRLPNTVFEHGRPRQTNKKWRVDMFRREEFDSTAFGRSNQAPFVLPAFHSTSGISIRNVSQTKVFVGFRPANGKKTTSSCRRIVRPKQQSQRRFSVSFDDVRIIVIRNHTCRPGRHGRRFRLFAWNIEKQNEKKKKKPAAFERDWKPSGNRDDGVTRE